MITKILACIIIFILCIFSAIEKNGLKYNILPVDQKNQKRFTLLSSKKTGIDFNNKLKDERHRNILIYSNYYGGAGVAVIDINNDGLQDLFFAGNLVGDKLYLNKGDLSFEDITQSAGIEDNGGWSSGIAIADVNQDGWLDIYVTRELYDENPELRKNKLYLNQGNLKFKESSAKLGVDDSQRSRHALFFDYDLDGDADLFVLNQPPNPGNFSPLKHVDRSNPEYSSKLYENQGSTFKDVTKKAGLLKTGYPNSAVARDFDGDGLTDLFVANDFEAPDFFYKNNGDGTFTDKLTESMRHISYFSMGVDAADINNDGLEDLMVLDMVAEDNYRLKANMGGMDIKAFSDVVNSGGHYQYMFNNLHLNQGNNQFSEVAALAGVSSTDWSWSNLIADFDNDGWKDIHITNGLLRDIRNSDAAKTFPQKVLQIVTEYYEKHPKEPTRNVLDIIDLQEVLNTLPSQPLTNYAYKNNGDLTFSKVMSQWGLEDKSFSNGSAVADLDNDGDLEIIVNNVNQEAFIYNNNGEKFNNNNYLRIQTMIDHKVMEGTRVEISTENGNQTAEIHKTKGMYSVSEPVAHFGLGSVSTVNKVVVTWPDKTITILSNVDANQLLKIKKQKTVDADKLELAVQKLFELKNNPAPIGHKHLENSFDDYQKQVLLPHKLSQFGPAMAIGDVNNDGLDDIYLGGSAGVSGDLYVQHKDNTFSLQTTPPWYEHKSSEDIDALFLDVDLDNDIDLFVVSGGNEFSPNAPQYHDRLYLNDGHGTFYYSKERIDDYAVSGARVKPFDFDKDGDLDLFIAGKFIPHDYPSPASSVLLVNDNGYFKNKTSALAPGLENVGLINDAAWVDYDQDGLTDLIVAGEWMPVTIFKNNGLGFTKVMQPTGLENQLGWWFSIETGDMDNDGDMDLVAGNLGLNYKYKASEEEPFEVHYDDFDNNGSHDIVLSYYNFGERFPVRGRSCSAQQVPELKDKFPAYNLFADADLESIYGKAKLKKALRLEATDFASTYFENLGNGSFKASKLPVLSQFSSINDIILKDLNGDGHKDIVAAGNLYVSEIETTRNDAGLGMVLLGNGKGEFEAIPAVKSGLYAPWDVKKISLINIGKTTHLVMATNNDYLRFFMINK